jgi:hypothetical protein
LSRVNVGRIFVADLASRDLEKELHEFAASFYADALGRARHVHVAR